MTPHRRGNVALERRARLKWTVDFTRRRDPRERRTAPLTTPEQAGACGVAWRLAPRAPTSGSGRAGSAGTRGAAGHPCPPFPGDAGHVTRPSAGHVADTGRAGPEALLQTATPRSSVCTEASPTGGIALAPGVRLFTIQLVSSTVALEGTPMPGFTTSSRLPAP